MLTIQQIQKVVTDYFKDKPVKTVYLFGSYARGEAKENSDVDLLVDIERSKGVGLSSLVWYLDLQKELNVAVDIVPNVEKPEHTSNWKFIVAINKGKKLLYEKG
jgi:predicted nucleotidyltransferase